MSPITWKPLFYASITLAGSAASELPSPDSFQLHPSLDISIFAAEPFIIDPVAMCFDANGNAYVVEMRDYPEGSPSNSTTQGGTIRLLEDLDHDGKADRSTLFADNLSFPTSITPWRGGVLVTAPPDILYLRDNDGDGVANEREIWFTGFQLGVTDSNANGLRWGIDNRIHGANGGNGGRIRASNTSDEQLELRNQDFAFDPRTRSFSLTFHTSAGFGLAFDDWGRAFATYNIDHIQHRIAPSRYFESVNGLPPVSLTFSISDHGEMARIFPISTAVTRVNHPEQAGYFSSAGGMGFISGGHFAPALRGSILVGDVVGNLIHRDVIEPDGASFVAQRAPEEMDQEFLASADSSFRPVAMELGPDGALYIADMRRDVIEHPDYIPEKVKNGMDIRAGANRGRIYRVAPKAGLPETDRPLARLSSIELAKRLGSPNRWIRDTAQRLLIEREAVDVAPDLNRMTTGSINPLERLHALWTLQGLDLLTFETLVPRLNDERPEIRENALVMSESWIAAHPQIQDRVTRLLNDPNPRVRFQAALTVSTLPSAPVESLVALLKNDFRDPWIRRAALLCVRSQAPIVLQTLLNEKFFQTDDAEDRRGLLSELAALTAAAWTPETLSFADDDWASGLDDSQLASLIDGFRAGIARRSEPLVTSVSLLDPIRGRLAGGAPELLVSAWTFLRVLGQRPPAELIQRLHSALVKLSTPSPLSDEDRRLIPLLQFGAYPDVAPVIRSLLETHIAENTQTATLGTLRSFSEPRIAADIIAAWSSLTPGARPMAIQLLLSRNPFHPKLLDAIESGTITLGELNLDLEQRRRLLRESTDEVAERAAALFGDEEYSNRSEAAAAAFEALPKTGDAAAGKPLFELHCAQCHRSGGIGFAVGPDLAGLSHRSVEDLLYNILDPAMAINPAYATYTATLRDGEVVSGILVQETPATVVLLQAQGIRNEIPRAQITSLKTGGISLMPEGFEQLMSPQQLRDLIAFLQQ